MTIYPAWKFRGCYKLVIFLVGLTVVSIFVLTPEKTFVSNSYIINQSRKTGIANVRIKTDITMKNEQEEDDMKADIRGDTNKGTKIIQPYDIVINSYMRSGSSFTGQLLAYHPDTFYWYEPLWNYHSGVYYWGKDKVCSGRSYCSRSHASLNADKMHEVLKMMYSCNFGTLVPAVAEKMTPSYSGKVWTPYIQCRSSHGSISECLMKMEEVCRLAKHRATKIVRFTVDNLEHMLENLPNVKVIHLMRDPRAIINSRITTTWYTLRESPQDNHQAIRTDAKDLCSRMMYDLEAALSLKKKYPTRFALVMYEDLQADLKRKAGLLYDYFGIDKAPLNEKLENMTDILPSEHTERIQTGDHTNWWRFRLMFSAVKAVDDVCKNVSESLGYRMFTSEDELKNSSLKAFTFDQQFLIENIDRTNSYDFKIS